MKKVLVVGDPNIGKADTLAQDVAKMSMSSVHSAISKQKPIWMLHYEKAHLNGNCIYNEYELIKQKKSKLSANKRKYIVSLIEERTIIRS